MLAAGNLKIAARIAEMLNEHNNLPKKYHPADIIDARARYYPITIADTVLASVAIERLNFLLTEVKHLVVAPNLRGLGLGKKLIEMASLKAKTPYLVATVRVDNAASLHIFEGMGFETLALVDNAGHQLRLIGRPRDKPKQN